MSVEGELVAEQRPEPRPRRELRRLPAKVLQGGVAALLKFRIGYGGYEICDRLQNLVI